MRAVPACLVLLMATLSLRGVEEDRSQPGPGNNAWARALSQRLARDKIMVSSEEVKQSFSAYLGHGLPNFITSDAVLNAYHVLLEETLRRSEVLHASRLRRFCAEDWALLATIDRTYAGDAATIQAAKKRARFVMGVAVKLMGEDVSLADELLRDAIEAEAGLLEKAEGQHMPALLGTPEPGFVGLDYSLFRPVGFYANSPVLQGYFRALRWLQLVPFRLERRDDLLAWHMLERSMAMPRHWKDDGNGSPERTLIDAQWLPKGGSMESWERLDDFLAQREHFFEHLGALFSHLDIRDARIANEEEFPIRIDDAFFQRHEDALRERFPPANGDEPVVVNDRLSEGGPASRGVETRVLSAVRLPEDVALAASASLKAGRSPGLEFATWLGLPGASQRLRSLANGEERAARLAKHAPERYAYAVEEDKDKPWWTVLPENYWGSLTQYHAALASLEEVDPRAPAFMRSKLWEVKTLQTVAASWAQERHAWALQALPEVHSLKSPGKSQGFIEPAPPFFLRLSWVAGQLGELAAQTEALLDPVEPFIEEAAEHARWLRKSADEKASKQDLFSDVWAAQEFLGKLDEPYDWVDADKATASDALRLADKMASCARRLREEARPGTPLWGKVQSQRLWTDRLWHRLEWLCLRLSLLADKQLSGLPFNQNEAAFVDHLGIQLSQIMLYRGQAWTDPADDAPRIARLFSDPRSGEVTHVGIGRPRLMYVLYPWKGEEVLCRGVVMPYHETKTANNSLTDEEWRKQFEAKERPPVPEWLKDLVPTEGVTVVKP